LEFEDVWLEARACQDGSAADVNDAMLGVPVISEVIKAAADANKHPGIWDFSRRLGAGEMEAIRDALHLAKTAEDGRSVSYSANVAYKGSRYTLTLFAVKKSQ
jgi:hypothetical protein